MVDVTDRDPDSSCNPEIREFWDTFQNWAVTHRSRATLQEYSTWFEQITAFTGARFLGDINCRDVEAFKSRLLLQGMKKRSGLEYASINNALKTLSSIYNHAIKLGLFTGENPVIGVERFKFAERAEQDFLPKILVDKLIETARIYGQEKFVKSNEARNVYLAIALMALAGLRRREVCFALWEWIDWDARLMTVSSHGEFLTKNRRSRVISLSSQLMEILTPYRQEKGYILEEVRASGGKTQYRADFRKGFAQVCKLAGIETTPHQLRHSFASRHAVAGTSLHVLAGWLGHSSTWVTQCYAHFQKTYNEAANNI